VDYALKVTASIVFCVGLAPVAVFGLPNWDTLSDQPGWDTLTVEVKETAKAAEVLHLAVIYSANCEPCREMAPVLRRLKDQGYGITFIDGDSPKSQGLLEFYGITATPAYLFYRGHECVETAAGRLSYEDLIAWFNRVSTGQPPPEGGRYAVCTAQSRLFNSTEEKNGYLHYTLASPTCGMMWCVVHGGGWIAEVIEPPTAPKIVEWVGADPYWFGRDENGQWWKGLPGRTMVKVEFPPHPASQCPLKGCPAGG
jgi:thiol-disulfide isomerase/thioredoxin